MFFHFSRIVTSNHVIDVVEKIEDADDISIKETREMEKRS